MLKPFLFVYNVAAAQRQEVLDHLDACREVKNWYTFVSNAVFIVSDSSAAEVAAAIRTKFPTLFMVVSEMHAGENDGWLPKKAWEHINAPKSSGRWPD